MARERFLPVVIHKETCRGCGRCQQACNNDAIIFKGRERYVDYSKCKACGSCIKVCPVNAITVVGVYEGDIIDITIDQDKCKHSSFDGEDSCTSCIDVCPGGIYQVEDGRIKIRLDRIGMCKSCQACVAACPTNAIVLHQV